MILEGIVLGIIGLVTGWAGGYVARWRLTVRQQACESAVIDLGARVNSEVKKRAINTRYDQKAVLEEIAKQQQQRQLPMSPDEILNYPDG